MESKRTNTTIENFRARLDQLDQLPVPEVTEADWIKFNVHVPVDQVIVGAIKDAPKAVFKDNAPGDPVAAYLECIKSLCNTTGGTWVDNDPDRAAGCYFKSKVGAAGYAVSAWTCLPGGLLKFVFA